MKHALALLLLLPSLVSAKPLAIAEEQGIVITLTDEPCAVAEIKNLPYRAMWKEKDKAYEGCYGLNSQAVVSYWTDKTVALMPVGIFKKAVEI